MSDAAFVVFQGDRVLLDADGRLPTTVPVGVEDPPLGPLDAGPPDGGRPFPVHVWPAEAPPDGLDAVPLRAAFPLLGEELVSVGRAAHLLGWRRTHRYCGRCGEPNRPATEGGLRCTACDLTAFPRLAPAIIVLIHDGDRALLGRAPRYPDGMYSTLAGFVEPGETLEEAVVREVFEEAGVEVADPRYLGSQHWPFPHSLMVGFHARWASGEPICRDGELEDVRWFERDELPRIPPRESIANRLIRAWVDAD